MNFESYKQLLLCKQDKDIILKRGKSFTLDFELDDAEGADRIFMTGETSIYYNWKTEGDYEYLYRRLDDSLSSDEANKARFALDMSAENFDFPKIAYHKRVWPHPFFGDGKVWRTGISAKAENLKIHDGGHLHLLVEIRYMGEVDKRLVYTTPDVVAKIDIPEGSYDWRDLEFVFDNVTKPIGSVCVYLEGMHYSGKVFCEKPYFYSENEMSLIPDFSTFTHDKPMFNWFGVNLSRVEWPCFRVMLNGNVIHDGEIFERCHRYSEWEFAIPKGVAKVGKNTLEITHTSNYRDVAPYNIHELGIVSVRHDTLISCPEVVKVGEPFAVLVKTEIDHAEYTLRNAPEYLKIASPLVCKRAGLNVLHFICERAVNDIDFTIETNGIKAECHIDRCVIRGEDTVITGTGDSVYVNQNDKDFDNFFSWYFSNNIGNMVTFRPTYRWCGSRAAKSELWRRTANLLDDMGVKYVLMRDGREIPGCNANPTVPELESKNFLGRQNHELDGHFVYGGTRDVSNDLNVQMFYDLYVRFALTDLERMDVRFTKDTYRATNGMLHAFKDHLTKLDMEDLANYLVYWLGKFRHGSERHTGPASVFKYFYQAGYTWTGAELMYSSTEATNSALRGAAKVYGGAKGAHLATQWSTTPHDTPEHSKRYRLSLYTSYMEDLDDINTEEGLWRMEEFFAYHHRYSDACISHLKQHQDFFRYLTTHTRSGKFYTPVAFLHGRYDGWNIFCCVWGEFHVFGRRDCLYTDAEYGWDMLDVFYPHSKPGALYKHNCPTDKPIGHYSGTPSGSVDVLPIEAKDYSEYPLICAVAYNKALDEDMDKLSAYVNGGGTLFIGTAQLTVTTDIEDIRNYNLKYTSHPFAKQISTLSEFMEDSYNGNEIHVCASIPENATVLVTTDNGKALIYSIEIGKGKAVVLNTLEYAANPAICPLVRETLKKLGDEAFDKEYAWAEGDDVIQFTAYKQDNGDVHFYFLSTDWYCADEPERTAKIRIGNDKYDVRISFGRMIKALVSNGVGAWFENEECDVLEISGGKICVQGTGEGILNIAANGEQRRVKVCFDENSVQTIEI